jgi:hypothetical protein
MFVIPPLAITTSVLTSSTVTDPMAPADYAGGTTYALGALANYSGLVYRSLQSSNVGNQPDLSPLFWTLVGPKEVAYVGGTTYAASVYVTYANRVYQSLQASNTGNTPLISPLWWSYVGPTNKWAMFDLLRNTATVAGTSLVVVLTPGIRIDTIGFVGVVADSVRIQVTSGGVGVYDQTQTLSQTSYIGNWYQYFFATFSQADATLFQNIPPNSNNIITITFTKAAGSIECGSVIIGTQVNLGGVQYTASDDALNFSTINRDAFGNSILIPRRSVPKFTPVTWLPATQIKSVRAVRDLLNAVPALWVGIGDTASVFFDSMLILGIYKQFTINLTYTDTAVITFEIEEV